MNDQDRIARLEAEVVELKAAYHDVAFEFTDALHARIRLLHEELSVALRACEKNNQDTTSAAVEGAKAATEAAVNQVYKQLFDAIVTEISSGRLVITTRSAQRHEFSRAVPVRQEPR
jgi:hypothetical protein